MTATTASLPTNVRVSTESVRSGDVIRTGWGTLHIIDREVTGVERWMHNGYTNAMLTFADDTTEAMWAGTIYPAIRA